MKFLPVCLMATFLSSAVCASDSDKMVEQHLYEAESKVEQSNAGSKQASSPYDQVKMAPRKSSNPYDNVKMAPREEGVKMHKTDDKPRNISR